VSECNGMNALKTKFADKLNILGFPCNQFGHQSNEDSKEFVNTLRYVRPGATEGKPFEPKFHIFDLVDVNGANSHPLFQWMRSKIPFPETTTKSTSGTGISDDMVLILPRAKFGNQTYSLWSPVSRNDVAWNFEKFLFNKEGELVKRFSRYHPTTEIEADIQALL